MFRSLLSGHVVRKLREHDLLIPAGLLVVSETSVGVAGDGSFAYGELEQAFELFVSAFEIRYGEGIAHYLRGWPTSKADIEMSVAAVMDETFSGTDMGWSQIAAVTAYITQVSLSCARLRLHCAIVPLVNYAGEAVDEHLTGFVRGQGGWAAFALAFRGDDHNRPTWAQKLKEVVGWSIALAVATVLAGVLLH